MGGLSIDTAGHDLLRDLGWDDRWAALTAVASEAQDRQGLVPGRVVRHDGVAVTVATAGGVVQRPVLAGVEPVPVVGDWVVLNHDAVFATLARASLLRRRDPVRDVEQPIVANLDAVLVVLGLDRPVKPGRVQRISTIATDAGAQPIVVLTKADLSGDPKREAGTVRAADPGIEVVITSTVSGEGIDEVRRLCADRTVVLVGESGAGKSSLTNSLLGADAAGVGAVRATDAKGRHTTTARELHLLPGGGVLVDTPGIRSVGLWTDAGAVASTFDDIETLATECRFSDCGHESEPGCAVSEAIAAGELHPARLQAWRTLLSEADEAAEQAEARARRANRRRGVPLPHGTDDDPRRGR